MAKVAPADNVHVSTAQPRKYCGPHGAFHIRL